MAADGTAEEILEKWRKCDTALREQRRDYWINQAFYEGMQWIIWNDVTRQVAEFPRARDDERVRMTANRLQPNIITLLARLTSRELGFENRPTATDDSAMTGARLAEHVLSAEQQAQGWSRSRVNALLSTFLGGTSFGMVEWDPQAGEELAVDPETGKVIGTGQARMSTFSIAEGCLEPGTDDWRDARWGMRAQAMPPRQAMERYGLSEEPKANSSTGSGPLSARLWGAKGHGPGVGLTTVYTYYEKPNHHTKKGRHLVVVGDETAIDRAWPFPWKDRLNIFPQVQTPLPGRYFGHTIVTDARPLQAAYNHFLSIMHEHLKQTALARMLLPSSAMVDVDALDDRPGSTIEYDDQAQHQPSWMTPPQLQRWIVEHGQGLAASIDDLMYVHDISRGEAPGDRNSGLALSVLGEKDETPMSVMSQNQADFWSEAGSMVLKLYEQKAIEPRTAVVTTDGIPTKREWIGINLRGQTDVKVPLESVTPHSKAATQAWLMDLFAAIPASVPPDIGSLAKLLELPNPSAFTAFTNAAVADAIAENAEMFSGEIPWVGEQPRPLLFETHDTHIAEHNRARMSQAYWRADADVRAVFDAHILAHEKLALQQAMEQRDTNQIMPGAGAIPQGDEPPGSLVPQDNAERMSAPAA